MARVRIPILMLWLTPLFFRKSNNSRLQEPFYFSLLVYLNLWISKNLAVNHVSDCGLNINLFFHQLNYKLTECMDQHFVHPFNWEWSACGCLLNLIEGDYLDETGTLYFIFSTYASFIQDFIFSLFNSKSRLQFIARVVMYSTCSPLPILLAFFTLHNTWWNLEVTFNFFNIYMCIHLNGDNVLYWKYLWFWIFSCFSALLIVNVIQEVMQHNSLIIK